MTGLIWFDIKKTGVLAHTGCNLLVTVVVKLVLFFKGSLNRLDLLSTGAPTHGGTGDESPMTAFETNGHGDRGSYSQFFAAEITLIFRVCGSWKAQNLVMLFHRCRNFRILNHQVDKFQRSKVAG